MALLALWHVESGDLGHDLTYTFREPYVGRVEVRAEDSAGGPPWIPEYVEDRTAGGELHAVTVSPDEDWIYPVKIKIRGAHHDG